MKFMNKKKFLQTVCVVYTLLSIFEVILESVINGGIDNNKGNLIWMLALSAIATFVLFLHYYLRSFPIGLVIIGQYIALVAVIMVCIWIEGHFVELHPDAYKDMLRSFTIPYIIGATIYYLKFWYEVKRANAILKELKSGKER